MTEVSITLGGQLTVGKVILDPGEIQGVGDWYNPSLCMPIKIQLYPTIKGEQLALIRLNASLSLTENKDKKNQFGANVSYDLLYNLPNRTTTGTSPSKGGVQLLFNLTHFQIKQLEHLRHEPNCFLYLHLEPIMVRLKQSVQANLTLGDQQVGIGLQSDLAFLWLASIETLSINTAEMNWTKNILPGIGFDQFRLVEVRLPTSDVLVPKQAIEYFDKAKKYYDEGNTTECLRECRLTLEEIEKHLQVQNHLLGNAVTEKLGWPNQAQLPEQAKYLNHTWPGLYILANAASHTPSTQSLLPADARTGFLSVAVVLEYLDQLQ